MRRLIALSLSVILLLTVFITTALSDEDTFRLCTFGSYEQDGNAINGKEPIEWIILLDDGDSCFLISRYILSLQLYNIEKVDVTWETCNLRKWMNSDFLDDAFSVSEQQMLYEVKTETNGSEEIYDWVFCLSEEELKSVLPSLADRIAFPTAVVYCNANYVDTGDVSGQWWLRSTSEYNGTFRTAQDVFASGIIGFDNIRCRTVGVRPVICVEKSAIEATFHDISRSELFAKPDYSSLLSEEKVPVEETLAEALNSSSHIDSYGCTINCPYTWAILTKNMTDKQLEAFGGMTADQVNDLLEQSGDEFIAIEIFTQTELTATSNKLPYEISLKEQTPEFLEVFAASFEQQLKSKGIPGITDHEIIYTEYNVYVKFGYRLGYDETAPYMYSYVTTANGMMYTFIFKSAEAFTPAIEKDISDIIQNIVWD